MAHVDVDLSFAKYIAQRRGSEAQRRRDGAAYAYSGDRKFTKTLQAARPVSLAIEASVRLWNNMARAELLGSCVKVTGNQFPKLYDLTAECARTLQIPMPTVYVAPTIGELNARTLGTEQDSYIVINAALIDHLSDDELKFVIGHECGHIHNSHVVYSTALHYLSVAASIFVRWIVQPALLALRAWSRRAEITCDRAGLLCAPDIDVATAAVVKLGLGSKKLYDDINIEEVLKQLGEGRRGIGRFGEYFRSHPYLPKRIEALRFFARSTLYMQATGQGSGELDAARLDVAVADVLRVT